MTENNNTEAGKCCEAMKRASTLSCTIHTRPEDCPDVLVVWSPQHGPALPVRDGGLSFVTICHCPWCGTLIGKPEEHEDDLDSEIADRDTPMPS